VPPGTVLVVGAANSGCQIAEEMSATRTVELAAGQRMPAIPQRPLGRDVWWWASGLRLDRVTVGSRLGRRLAGRDQVIGGGPRQLARRHGVRIRPRVTGAAGRTVTFADGAAAEFDAVVWATGFTTSHAWIDAPGVHDAQGRIIHQRGVTPSPGLYVLGLTWQHTRGSALLGWVGNDAAFLAGQIAARAAVAADPGAAARSPAATSPGRPAPT
jgi:putative flavoprotein involved in K+ transport